MCRIAGNTAADDDPHEIPLARQPLAGIVKPPSQLQAAEFRVHHHLDAVERFALRPVIADESRVSDLIEVVIILVQLEIEDQAARRRYELPLIFDSNLPFGEVRQLALELLARPDIRHVGKTLPLQRCHSLPIGLLERPDYKVLLKLLEV